MERDPQTEIRPTDPAAPEAAGGPDPVTDGRPAPADPAPPDAAPATERAQQPAGPDGAAAEGADAAPEAAAAEASAAQASDDAAAESEPAAAPPAAEPDYRDQYLRAMAELDNVRKRARRDVSQAEARGIAKLARELLPAIDNFGRALDAAEAQPENRDHHLTDGIRLVQNELLSALARGC